MKPAAILALLLLALALLSFLLYFLLPNIVAFVMGWDPSWGGDPEHLCPAQEPIVPAEYCGSEPEKPREPGTACLPMVNLDHPCWMLRQYLLWFGALCLLLSLIFAAYHSIVEEKVKSGSRHP